MTALDPLLLLSATELASRIRRREVTSEAVVEAHLAHAARVNPRLNAIVVDRYAEARREAREADQLPARTPASELPPLHGVPCTIKESFSFSGMPNSSGLVARKHVRATSDAPTVARLRAAGAIALGVTNTSELCMWMESQNHVYGRTKNPYDVRRTAGGSSGGEGAIVGSGASPFGLGSDVGGSIRMPAFFCGVFGHKPSVGLVPNAGQYPQAHGSADRLLGTGPLARRADDLWPLLRVLSGGVPGLAPGDVSLRGITVLDVATSGVLHPSAELRRAQEDAAASLARRGATVRPFRSKYLPRALEVWAARMSDGGGPSYAEMLGNGVAVKPGRELARWVAGRSPYTLPSLFLALVEQVPKALPARAQAAREAHDALRAEIHGALEGGRTVMLYPPYTRVAPKHLTPLFVPIEYMYTAAINALELPATQVPLGLSREGVPLGVQVVGPHGGDALTVAVAKALEESHGGWQAPG